MCKQKTLTVAIASALMASSGVATAVDQFQNAYEGMMPPVHDTTAEPPKPLSSLGFASETLVKGDEDGIVYASELFGNGSSSLTLPSGTTTGVGTHAAVTYTIDGKVTKKFDMTFTLTNGATFASAPILAVDTTTAGGGSSMANANVTIDYSSTTANIMINPRDAANVPTSIGTGTVVQFSPSAELYEVTAKSATSTANYIEVKPLGGSTTGLSYALNADPNPVDVFYVNPIGTGGVANVIDSTFTAGTSNVNADGIAADPDGSNVTGTAADFVVGGKYRFGDAGTSVIKEINGTTLVLTTPITRAFTADAAGGDNALTRVYSTTDSNVQIEATGGMAGTCGGATDIDTCPLDDATVPVATADQTNNVIQFAGHTSTYKVLNGTVAMATNTKILDLDKNLTASVANGEAMYRSLMRGTTPDESSGWTATLTPKSGTGAGKSTATFELDATQDGTNLANGTRLVMVYNINKATALADPGQEIKMQVSLVTPIDQILVNPARELVIAESKKGLEEATLRKVEDGRVRISVDSGSTAFTGTTPGPYVTATTVQIGYINIDNAKGVKTADAETDFELGQAGAKASASTMDIEEGQFAASVSKDGKVYIRANTSEMEASNTMETTAHWDLSDTNLGTIADAAEDKTTIRFTADGDVAINVNTENPPTATLVIDFDLETTEDLTLTAELNKIKQDGTVCTLYNVPRSGAQDEINIRITNESSSSDDLVCSLRDKTGAILLDGVNCFQDELGNSVPIGPMETKRLTSAMLEALDPTMAWTSRGVLTIKSSLPKMEVFGMLRNQAPGSPLTNMSVGAHGEGCIQ